MGYLVPFTEIRGDIGRDTQILKTYLHLTSPSGCCFGSEK